MRQLQETLGNVAYQLWVLQVVGSNPAAPTKYCRNINFLQETQDQPARCRDRGVVG